MALSIYVVSKGFLEAKGWAELLVEMIFVRLEFEREFSS